MEDNIIVLSKRDKCPEGYRSIDTTSKNPDASLRKGYSPFYIGPVNCYDGLCSRRMENAWQYSKVYKVHMDPNGEPNEEYFKWRDSGFENGFADRYPLGKGNMPEYSYWKVDGTYKKLGYIEARKKIYVPLYAKSVVGTSAYQYLTDLRDTGSKIALVDFDGYNYIRLGMSLKDVVNCESRKMGHAFVLAMLLKQNIAIKEGNVIDLEGILV